MGHRSGLVGQPSLTLPIQGEGATRTVAPTYRPADLPTSELGYWHGRIEGHRLAGSFAVTCPTKSRGCSTGVRCAWRPGISYGTNCNGISRGQAHILIRQLSASFTEFTPAADRVRQLPDKLLDDLTDAIAMHRSWSEIEPMLRQPDEE